MDEWPLLTEVILKFDVERLLFLFLEIMPMPFKWVSSFKVDLRGAGFLSEESLLLYNARWKSEK